ncbi:glutathione S-transferase family protein [soil metagenome]
MTEATLKLYAHPLSSYCWKVLTALYEQEAVFDYRELGQDFPQHGAELGKAWPIGRFPVLIDGDRVVAEASIIIEYLDSVHPAAAPMIPREGGEAALRVRFLDRFFDNYVMTPMTAVVADEIRSDGSRDPYAVQQARAMLARAYAWLEGEIGERWAAGDDFSLADCAAAPSLYYADKVQPLGSAFPKVAAYLERLKARPSVARAVAEAQPYWHMFPLAE